MNSRLIIGVFFIFSCYKADLDKINIPNIKDIPSQSNNIESNYCLRDFWDAEKDSSLFLLINEFNLNSSQIAVLDNRAKMNEMEYKISGSERSPGLSVGLSQSKRRQNLSAYGLPDDFLDALEGSGDSDGAPDILSAELKTQWEVDLWSRLKSKDVSRYYTLQSHLNDILYAQESIRANFIKLFLTAINLKNQISVLDQNLNNLRLIKDLTEKRYLEGISNPDEIHLASANYHLYQTKLLAAENQYNDIVRNIEIMMSRYPNNKIKINYSYPSIDLPLITEGISSMLLERRPDIVSMKEKIISSNAMLFSNKKNLFPNISLTGSAGQSSSDLKRILDKDFSVWSVGITVFQPIFQGKKLKNIVKLNEYQIESLEKEYVHTVYNAFYEVEKYIDMDTYLIKTYDEIVASKNEISKAVDYAIKSYELGLIDLVYLLNYQQQSFEIALEENRVLSEKYINRINLILALGGKFEY